MENKTCNASNENKAKNMNRRSFVKTGVVAGASLIMAPMIMKHARANDSNDLHIALLGAGAQGQVLLNACLKIPNIRFKAVCDIWSEYSLKRAYNLLQKYGHDLKAYQDYREMLSGQKDIDAVLITTPDFWHAAHTEGCLEAGLHVYCEKEMSNTLEGCRRIVRAAKKSNKLVQIGHQRRSNPRYLHCVDVLLQKARLLGRITTINGQWNRSVQPDLGWPEKFTIPQTVLRQYGYQSMQQFRNWRWYKALGGGPIVDLGSHQIDIYNWFLKAQPVSVFASGGTDYYEKRGHEWYDNVLAIYEYQTADGIARAYYQTITTNSNLGYYESFMGDEGTLQISESSGRGALYREQTAPAWDKWIEMGYLKAPEEAVEKPAAGAVIDVRETIAPPKHELPVVFTDPYHKPHLENFFNAIRGTENLNCPVETGYETAVTVLKVNEAVAAGRKLKFAPEEFRA